jgi:acetylornithine deacetylase/succinyl-diaminopimelate desuccinylase family protein
MTNWTDQTVLKLFQDIIRAPSPNPPGDITACADIVCAVLSEVGIPYEKRTSKPGVTNVVAWLDGSEGTDGPTFLFNGHLDTVPPGEDWERDPYDPQFDEGYVHGRGSTDMKGGIVASLLALVALKQEGARFKGKVIYTAVGDEEYHSLYGTKHLLEEGLTADYAVCCEPTDLDLDLGNRGLVMMDVWFKGRSSHAGRPHLGLNAVHIAARVIAAIDEMKFERFHHPAFEIPDGSCSVVGVSGGDKLNVIPDRCLLHIDRRLMPGESGPEAVREIADLIEKTTGIKPALEADPTHAEVSIEAEYWHEPFWLPETHPLAATAKETLRQVLGRPPKIGGKSAGTDASHLISMGGIPTVIIGPGEPRLSHTSREKARFQDVLAATEVYQKLASKILQTGSSIP